LVQFLYNDLSGTSDATIAIIPDMSDTDVATLVDKPHEYPHMTAVSLMLLATLRRWLVIDSTTACTRTIKSLYTVAEA
jgi:hypothetical protein